MNGDHGPWHVEVEGYLMWHAEVVRAQRQARAFTEQLPWLTTAQREEIERVYLADRTAASRVMLERIRDRAVELRHEYSARYLRVKLRCLAATVVSTCLVLAAGASVLLVR
ncbi:hypothetical protein [Streptomyces sp. HPF1205]|uniref:hypothetical protein n=1 Tax=Streptomyces sp. HPF1205 TaxID=2873262 RepID=UPI001CEDAD22|nr:hypothetical protein [Streptomyces sp. HPF1205]